MDLEAELRELKAQLAENRRRVRRLSATNLLLAIVVLAFGGATAAYAVTLAPANSVNTDAIIDRTIGTPDVKVGAFAGQTILDNSLTTLDIANNSLTGTDIRNNSVTGADIDEGTLIVTPADNSVTSSEVDDDSLTGDDIDEASLAAVCPTGMNRVGDICYGGVQGPLVGWGSALLDCAGEGLRLPSPSEAIQISLAITEPGGGFWTNDIYKNHAEPKYYAFNATDAGVTELDANQASWYICMTTVGARP